ncbi:MAG TPA: ArsA-related P-loop ATPase [Solirubrobacteraceae bacterium]|jgi:anion-transporting  ArsA/GET3 family ATPase|nr:ArsA-related P-loop ATPase [Solirubrobacteraceae bacterium]
MNVGEVLRDKRVCICGGSGGVGKTTTAAAVAMGMAAQGARVAVVTIDPARRLANALGLETLGNEPRPVESERFRAAGVEMRGELWAMMLDAKRTFDEVIERLAPDPATRDEIFANRIYQQLSNAVAGSQEYTAMSKLYDLHREGGFDLLVLDTPPSRNALDFLDAPDRLTRFLEGRALRVFLRPTGFATRVVGRGTGMVFTVLRRVTGVDLLEDVSVFFRALSGLLGGFRERATAVNRLLAAPETVFLLVTSPEREPIDEAIFFWRKLKAARMPFGGVIVNRVHHREAEGDPDAVAEALTGQLGESQARKVADNFRDYQVLARRDQRNIERLAAMLDDDRIVEVPYLDEDVHDIDGLRRIQRFLFASERERGRLFEELAA